MTAYDSNDLKSTLAYIKDPVMFMMTKNENDNNDSEWRLFYG